MMAYKNNLSYEKYLINERIKDDNVLLEMAVRILHNERIDKYNNYWIPKIQWFIFGAVFMCFIIQVVLFILRILYGITL